MSAARTAFKTIRRCAVGIAHFFVGLSVLLVALILTVLSFPTLVLGPVNSILEPLFEGKLVILDVQHVSLNGADGIDVNIVDPKGQVIGQAHDVSAKINVMQLLRQLLSSSNQLTIAIKEAKIRHVDLLLEPNDEGALKIAETFTLRPSKSPSSGQSPDVRVTIAPITVESAWIHGEFPEAARLDLSLQDLKTTLEYNHEWLTLDPVLAKGLARAPISGPLSLNAHVRLRFFNEQKPSPEVFDPLTGLESKSDLKLEVGNSSATLQFNRDNQNVQSQAQLLLAGSHATKLGLPLPELKLDVDINGTAAHAEANMYATSHASQLSSHITFTQAKLNQELSGTLKTQNLDLDRFGVHNLSPLTSEFTWSGSHANSRKLSDSSSYQVDLSGHIDAFEIMKTRTPSLTIRAALEQGGVQLSVFPVRESGARFSEDLERNKLEAQLQLDEAGALKLLEAKVNLNALWLNLLDKRLLVGSGNLEAEGRYDATHQQAQLRASGALYDSRWADKVRAERLEVSVYAVGPLTNPQFSAQVRTKALSIADRTIDASVVTAQGTLSSALVTGTLTEQERRLELGGRLSWANEALTVQSAHATVDAARTSVGLLVDEFSVKQGLIQFQGLRTKSTPDARLSGRVSANEITVQGSLRDVAVGKIGETLGIDGLPFDGVINLDADATVRSGYTTGRVHTLVSFLTFNEETQISLPPLWLELDAVGTGKEFDVIVHARRQDGQETAPHVEAMVHGIVPPASELSQPKLLFNRLQNIELAGLLPLHLLKTWLPKDVSVEGKAQVFAHLERENQHDFPAFRVRTETHGLVANVPLSFSNEQEEPPRDNGQAVEHVPKRRLVLKDADVTMSASYNPSRGETRLLVGATTNDQLLIGARLAVDQSPRTLLGFSRDQLSQLPIDAELWIPPRDMASWPEPLRPPSVRGNVEGHASLQGSLLRPRFELSVKGNDLALDREDDWEIAAKNAAARVTYDSERLTFQVDSSGGKRLQAHIDAQLLAPWDPQQMLPRPETLDAKIDLDQLPLSLVPQLSDRSIQGTTSAHLVVSDWGTERRKVEGKITLAEAMIDQVAVSGAELKIGVDRQQARLDLALNQKEYRLELHGKAGLKSEAAWIPTLNDSLEADLLVDKFPLELLRPVVGSMLAELSGTLNARARIQSHDNGPKAEGVLKISDASFQIPQVGQRISDVDAVIKLTPDGQLSVKDATFRGASGKGTLNIDGQMASFRPKSVRARLSVDKNDRLPLSMAGLGLGEFWGNIETDIDLNYDEHKMVVATKIRQFQLRFPELPTSQVQGLQDAEGIFIGTQLKNDEWIEIPLQPISNNTKADSAWRLLIKIDLGRKLWLEQGPTRRVQLAGKFQIDAADEVQMSGQIRIPRGHIEINGRMFEIREGTLSFQENDPSNPILFADARWTSSEGITVIARFSGPVKSGEMTLSSEPALPEDQVLSLLLFGDTSGLSNLGADQAESDSTMQAAKVGGSFAAQGLNKALSRVDAVDLSTRMSSSESGGVRPEVVMQLTNSLSAQLGYNLEEPSPGKSPDRTLLSVELRVIGGHSLSATVGDRGSSLLDWVWRYKY